MYKHSEGKVHHPPTLILTIAIVQRHAVAAAYRRLSSFTSVA